MTSVGSQRLAGVLLIALGLSIAWGFFIAGGHYQGWWYPSYETIRIAPEELCYDAWYVMYGGTSVAAVSTGLHLLGATDPLRRVLRALGRTRGLVALLILVCVAVPLLIRRLVLQGENIVDDESVYRFIAETLLHGRFVNPAPIAPEFLHNQFTVVNSRGWFGMYPIGHPLLLALAMRLHLGDLESPLLAGATAALTWFVGRRTLGPRRALLGLALLAVSPHFLFSFATQISQTTTTFALMAGVAALLQAERRGPAWLPVAGAAFGLGLLARPMPGGPLAVAGLASVLCRLRAKPRTAVMSALAFGLPVLVGGLGLVLTNHAESGEALRSGYHEEFGGVAVMGTYTGVIGLSVLGATLRESFWLLGWPVSLAPVLFARPHRGRLLLWGMVAAEMSYRVIVPKTVVSATGPIYVTETVPILALLAADGLARLWQRAKALDPKAGRAFLAGLVLSLELAAGFFFVTPRLWDLHVGASERHELPEAIAATGLPRGVVFADAIVDRSRFTTWAYYADEPEPDLSDAWLVLRLPQSHDGLDRAVALWQSRFADRPAFVYRPTEEVKLQRLKPTP